MKSALLLVDLQNDYLDATGLQPSRPDVIRGAAARLARARTEGTPVIHVVTTVDRERDNRMRHWRSAGKWICVRGTTGHLPPPELAPRDGEPVVHKQSFSGFESGRLDAILQEMGVDALIIAGVHLHGCVRQTALDAYARGLTVSIASEAVGSDDPIHAEITRRYLQQRGFDFADESAPDLDPLVNRLGSAFEQWSRRPSRERVELLRQWAEAVRQHAGELAHAVTAAIGKPITDARAEVARAAELIDVVCGFASAPLEQSGGSPSTLTRLRPHGVIAIITPWNNPVAIPIGKIAPALAYGNAVLWKPAPPADMLTDRLLDIFRAWLPPDLLAVVSGGGETGRRVLSHPGVSAATITGSPSAGAAAIEICTRRAIPLQAELGGNNAAIVWNDVRVSEVAERLADGAFGFAGQRCTANRRVIVHESIYDDFLREFTATAASLPFGDPFEESTRIGPVISAEAARRIAEAVDGAGLRGHRVTAVHPVPPSPLHIGATIVECADRADPIVQDETFGPVAVVQRAASWDEALSICNGVRQGLAAALFTSDTGLWNEFQRRAEAGILKLNDSTAGADAAAPFGGWKASGYGPPEHGAFDVHFYTRPQAIYRR